MKCTYKSVNGRMMFEVSGESAKDIFEQIANVQEVFDADSKCGCCDSANIKFRVRQVDDYTFYELVCADCHARLSFGQNKKGGGLFPKRKAEDGGWLSNNGWSKFEPKTVAEPVQDYRRR